MVSTFTIASNQGEMGGGEVMLLHLAEAARSLGRDVTVVGPESPGDLCDRAAEAGFDVVRIPGRSTQAYLWNLRRWDRRHRQGLLWCNGLRPAFTTAGRGARVVHLHQVPEGKLAALASIARRGALRTVVPSHSMQRQIDGSTVLWNWSAEATQRPRRTAHGHVELGFLGRLSRDKGVLVLLEAMRILERRSPGRYRLLLAGDTRFVAEDEAELIERAVVDLGPVVDRPGWMERADFFAAVDLAVFPSVWSEAFGLVATEAMAARCPLVVSDAGALPEVVGSDHPWIAPHGDPVALADTIERAASTPQDDVVERSYHRWSQEFSPDAGRAALAALLDDLDREGGGR